MNSWNAAGRMNPATDRWTTAAADHRPGLGVFEPGASLRPFRPIRPRPPFRPPFRPPWPGDDSSHIPNDFDFDGALRVAGQIHRYRKKITAEHHDHHAPVRDQMLASWIGPLGDDMRIRAQRIDGQWDQSMRDLRRLSKQLVDRWVDEVDDYNHRAYAWALNQPNSYPGHDWLKADPVMEFVGYDAASSASDVYTSFQPARFGQPEPPIPTSRPSNFTPDRPPYAVYARRGRFWVVDYVWEAPNPPKLITARLWRRSGNPPGWVPIPREEIVAALPNVRGSQSKHSINLSDVLEYLSTCRQNFWFIRWWRKGCQLEQAACHFADGTIDPHGVFDELKSLLRDMRIFRRLAARTYWRLEGPPPWWEPKLKAIEAPPIEPICSGELHPPIWGGTFPTIASPLTPAPWVARPPASPPNGIGPVDEIAADPSVLAQRPGRVAANPISAWGEQPANFVAAPIDAFIPTIATIAAANVATPRVAGSNDA